MSGEKGNPALAHVRQCDNDCMVAVARVDLRRAIEASDRAYGLLIWLGDLVDADKTSVGDARRILASPEVAALFLKRHAASLPADLKPPDDESEQLTANVLGTYLSVSFELDDEPGEVRRPDPYCGPGCPWCWHVTKGPHLHTKTVGRSDKKRADAASRQALQDLLSEENLSVVEEELEGLLRHRREEAATIAYAQALIDRARGRHSGSTALALWRRFAWRDGSPREGFHFDVDTVEQARASIINDLAA